MDPWVLEALAARRCLPLLAALLHVPNLQAKYVQEAGGLFPGQSAAHIQVPVQALSLHA